MNEVSALYTHFHSLLLNPDRIPLAMAAVFVVALAGLVTGPLAGNANPLAWAITGKLLGGFGVRLDRVQRGTGDLVLRGFFLTAIGLALYYVAGMAAFGLVRDWPLMGITEILLLSLTMTAGSVWFALLRLFFALREKKSSKGAYYTIATSTRADLSASDDYTITRTGMAYGARMFDKGIVAPVIWYLIAGLPGAYLYAGLAALSWRFGREGFTRGFGTVPLALEKLMGFVPGIVAGVLMAAAGTLTPTGGIVRGLTGLARNEGQAPYAEGGLPVTAMANALKIGLNGPVIDLDGRPHQRAWAGPPGATAQLDAGHLRRAIYICVMAHLLFLAGLGASLAVTPAGLAELKSWPLPDFRGLSLPAQPGGARE